MKRPRNKRMDMPVIVRLSRSELKILRTNGEIAHDLGITLGTAKWHLVQVFRKLEAKNRTAAAAKGRELKLL
jgi:LuxR family maltose regulon positive regulatory protein